MKTLTIELNVEGEALELHLNKDGAEYLRDKLNVLINNDLQDHCHLMTEDWGGNELTSKKQSNSSTTKLLHSLKIIYWNS
jgi:hypothetical protein